MDYWLVVGKSQNWEIAFKKGNIWGLKENQRHLWEVSVKVTFCSFMSHSL